MGLSPDTVSNIMYVFGVSCAIPCAFFLAGLRLTLPTAKAGGFSVR